MTQPQKPLGFTNRWIEEVIQETPNETDHLPLDGQFFFPDKTTKVVLAWEVTQNEWTQVFSALMYAIDSAYPNRAIDTMEIFLRTVTDNMTVCEEVTNCITTNTSTQQGIADAIEISTVIQQAIQQIINENYAGNGYPNAPLPPSIMASNIIPQIALCTEDNKYAMSRAIVQQLDTLATDFLDVIALISNNAEIAAEVVEAIPIFGGLASLALDFATYVNDNIKTSYDAAYNSTTELDYSCAIYCAFTNCDLTWDDVIATYEEQASVTPPTNTDFSTVITWFIDNVITSTDNIVVGAMHLFILNCLKYGSDWFGSGVWTTLEIAVEDAADEEITVPASCSCVSELCWEYDFTSGNQHGWVFVTSADSWIDAKRPADGQPVAGVNTGTLISAGDYQDRTGTQVRTLLIYKQFSADVDIREVQVDVNYDKGNGGGTDFQEHLFSLTSAPDEDGNLLLLTGASTVEGTDVTISNEVTKDGSRGILVWLKSDDGAPQQGTADMLRLRVITTASSNQPDDSVAC